MRHFSLDPAVATSVAASFHLMTVEEERDKRFGRAMAALFAHPSPVRHLLPILEGDPEQTAALMAEQKVANHLTLAEVPRDVLPDGIARRVLELAIEAGMNVCAYRQPNGAWTLWVISERLSPDEWVSGFTLPL